MRQKLLMTPRVQALYRLLRDNEPPSGEDGKGRPWARAFWPLASWGIIDRALGR